MSFDPKGLIADRLSDDHNLFKLRTAILPNQSVVAIYHAQRLIYSWLTIANACINVNNNNTDNNIGNDINNINIIKDENEGERRLIPPPDLDISEEDDTESRKLKVMEYIRSVKQWERKMLMKEFGISERLLRKIMIISDLTENMINAASAVEGATLYALLGFPKVGKKFPLIGKKEYIHDQQNIVREG